MAHIELNSDWGCVKSPDGSGKHAYFVDVDDKRFKSCAWCNNTVYRTDEELIKEIKEGEDDGA